jgi:hypothetical protein
MDEELPRYFPDFTSQSTPLAPTSASAPDSAIAETTNPSAPSGPPQLYDSSPASAQPAAGPTEPVGFGESTEGLRGSNAALTLVRGLSGKAVRVSRKGNRGTFAFYAAKRPMSKRAGAPYKVGAHVRTTSPGMYLCLRVQEYGRGAPTTTERCAPAKSGWRRVALKGQTAGKGHKLVFSIRVMAALGGTSFDVDGFRFGGRDLLGSA